MTAAYKIDPDALMSGWCVEVRHSHTRKDGTTVDLPSYWYGPDHGFGTTSGPIGTEPGDTGWQWYASRAEAQRAMRGSPIAGRKDYRPRRVADAMAEQAERRAKRAGR